jgi:hypothetical protein
MSLVVGAVRVHPIVYMDSVYMARVSPGAREKSDASYASAKTTLLGMHIHGFIIYGSCESPRSESTDAFVAIL